MNVWQSLTDIPGNEASVVTIGNFDGMHNGHKKVIATCVERAHKLGVDAVAITFDPHPIQVHKPEVGLQLISPLRDRLDAMEAAGLDATAVRSDAPRLIHWHAERARSAGAQLRTGARVTGIEPRPAGDGFEVSVQTETGTERIHARVVVNAAGAWADHVASLAGAAPLELTPAEANGRRRDPGGATRAGASAAGPS